MLYNISNQSTFKSYFQSIAQSSLVKNIYACGSVASGVYADLCNKLYEQFPEAKDTHWCELFLDVDGGNYGAFGHTITPKEVVTVGVGAFTVAYTALQVLCSRKARNESPEASTIV